MCLPLDPDWGTHFNGHQWSGYIAGVEYDGVDGVGNVFDERNAGGGLRNKPTPCAVCYIERASVLMIPAKQQCPDGWIKEYDGYLVSEFTAGQNRHRSNYACWDRAPEIATGGIDYNHALIYPVEAICGTLPCSTYPNYKELTCVVCSK